MHVLFSLISLLVIAVPLRAQQHHHHQQQHAQPYAGEETRQIKALSDSEIRAYLKGEGMGYGKAGELNQYPGPRHVLDLADQLGLSDEQRSSTQAIFETMRARAIELGERLVAQEQELDHLFAEAGIDESSLRLALHEIALTQADLRATHLIAHLSMRELLTAQQIGEYDRLRGYGRGHDHGGHH